MQPFWLGETSVSWGGVAAIGVLILLVIIYFVCLDIKRLPTRKEKLKLIRIYLVVAVVGIGLFVGITQFGVGDRWWPQPAFKVEPLL